VIGEGAQIGDSEALQRALETAAGAHRDQRRSDGSPYLSHPLAVCELLAARGAGETLLVAALLHDAVEDSELTVGDVADGFGVQVGELVAALTEDEEIDDWVERKNALRAQVAAAGEGAISIYAADKLANLREMQAIYRVHGEGAIDLHKAPTLDLRVAAWRLDADLAGELGDPRPAAELRDELERFERRRLQEVASAQEAGARG
jgi:(p)ppGpp synthase/HD superfamily hydrolase